MQCNFDRSTLALARYNLPLRYRAILLFYAKGPSLASIGLSTLAWVMSIANMTSQQPSQITEEALVMPIDELFVRLDTSESGLASQEARNRLEIYGYNEVLKRKKQTAIVEFLSHLRSPLIIILLFAGLISGFLGDPTNATIIFSIVLLSVILDYYQESKAERASEMLKEKVTTTTAVLRDNVKREVKLSEVVPGDVVLLSAGDIVPADARVIVAKDLFVNQ